MARTRTLGEMRSDIRIAADIVNQTRRHPDSQLNRWINQSIQRLREKVSQSGINYYLQTWPGQVLAGSSAVIIAVPPDIARVVAMDVSVNGRLVALTHMQMGERNDFGGTAPIPGLPGGGIGNAVEGVPVSYFAIGTSFRVNPIPDADYDLLIWYLPAWEDLTLDAETFDGISGWEDWVMWDVCQKVAVRDKNLELFQTSGASLVSVWADIAASVPKQANSGPMRRLDTRGRRRLSNEWRERRWPY